MILFWSQVTEPWKKLLEQAANGSKMNKGSKIPDDPNADPPPARESQRRQHRSDGPNPARTDPNRFVVRVLDFANLLAKQTPRVWRLLNGQAPLGR